MIVELLKAYRDGKIVGESPRRYINTNGEEVLASVSEFSLCYKVGYLESIGDYKWKITDRGRDFIDGK